MRGRGSGIDEALSFPSAAGSAAAGEGHLWQVKTDLGGAWPVTDAELDVIEAFLMPRVHTLMAAKTSATVDTLALEAGGGLGTAAKIRQNPAKNCGIGGCGEESAGCQTKDFRGS